jgi:hypothetical protein
METFICKGQWHVFVPVWVILVNGIKVLEQVLASGAIGFYYAIVCETYFTAAEQHAKWRNKTHMPPCLMTP